jgi:hypothetical protein
MRTTWCPLVWVLHSQAPVTGGCNYTLGCHRFAQRLRSGAPARELPGTTTSRGRSGTGRDRPRLRDLPLSFVAPSEAGVRAVGPGLSSLFSSKHVEVIPNRGSDERQVFQAVRPRGRPEAARAASGLREDRWAESPRSGWDHLLQGRGLPRRGAAPVFRSGRPVFLACRWRGRANVADSPDAGSRRQERSASSERGVRKCPPGPGRRRVRCRRAAPRRDRRRSRSLSSAETPVVAFAIGAALDLFVPGLRTGDSLGGGGGDA